MLSQYDLASSGRHSPATLAAWARGEHVDGLPRLSSAEASVLLDSWEWNARPGQRWIPGVEFITDIQAGRGWGKALRLDTPLPTPSGWTTMGEVAVGDHLLDEMGRPCTVLATYDVHAEEAWRLCFSDGTYVDACADHQWVTLDQLERKRMNRRLGGVMMAMWAYAPARSTREVVATLARGVRGDLNHCIPLAMPLTLPDADLPLDPYLLGLWLGDGHSDSPYITSHVDDATHYATRAAATGWTWERMKVRESIPHVGCYVIGRVDGQRNKFREGLVAMGILNAKRLPPQYLRASYAQRLALMQGLLDTDGTIDAESGQVEFCSMLPHLADSVVELARTLGQKPTLCVGRAVLRGVDHGEKYRVFWRPTLPVVSLPRKAALLHRLGDQALRNAHRMIVGAEPLPPQPMRCVTVDSPARMYLCGLGMIPTHNTVAGEEAINDAANVPELWGGEVCIVGPEPTQTINVCLTGPTGLYAGARRRARSGLGPGIRSQNWNNRVLQFEAPRGGGGGGLTVRWASASDPKSVHGMNVGLAWLDEFGVWNHRKRDEQGNNAWQALRPAIRTGLRKVIITQTPSRAPDVRALQRDAERPPCMTCRTADLLLHGGKWQGEVGQEPWRLPRSPQRYLHPLLDTRTTEPVRECPRCGGEVIAEVRTVFGATTDNVTLEAGSRREAALEVAAGTTAGRTRFSPRGEVDSCGAGSLVQDEHIERICFEAPDDAGRQAPVLDRWRLALDTLGADEVIVQVDPAVTATESSDETGVVATCRRMPQAGRVRRGVGGGGDAGDVHLSDLAQVVGLEDWSVRAGEVEEGAPSSVWAPRAYRLACLWGATRIVVETNQGGEEVLSAVLDLIHAGLTDAVAREWLALEYPNVAPQRLGVLARRVVASSRGIVVESVHRRENKAVRLEWYGRTAATGRQALLCADWHRDGAQHWQTTIGQVTGYEPPRQDARRERPRKDRGDVLVGSAQVLLGVRETGRGELVDHAGDGWLGEVVAGRGR